MHSDSQQCFHGDNTGSNPVGDAKQNQGLRLSFAFRSWVQKGHRSVPFLHPFKAVLLEIVYLIGAYQPQHRRELKRPLALGVWLASLLAYRR